MKVLQVRNVHSAFPYALRVLEDSGIRRNSRNGPVIQFPEPVTTVYEHPEETVLFWPQRDANPFFHLYEALWMLAGRNDVAPLERYVKNSINYSDDGMTLHGAYGYRWRKALGEDQLEIIAERLKKDPTDRRCVLQMWSMTEDLGRDGKDVPCNTIATFQRGENGKLNLVVFNRSNDIIWGAYGANAVQFGTLLEYMALWIECPIGTYSQVSVNWHAYNNELWKKMDPIRPDGTNFVSDPYRSKQVHHVPMIGSIEEIDRMIHALLASADNTIWNVNALHGPWAQMVYLVLKAHELYRIEEGEKRYLEPLKLLAQGDQKADWIIAAREWIERRHSNWQKKQELLEGIYDNRQKRNGGSS